jgi:ribosomal protein S16
MKHAGGRPTLYDESVNTEFERYLETTGKEQMELPTIQGFAIWLNVNTDTLYEWAKVHAEFSDTLKSLLQYQAKQLINDGIYGGKEVNSTIVKLLLQNNHGMKERVDATTNDKDITPMITLDTHASETTD